MEFHLIATCPEELKELVASELKDFGAKDIQQAYKAVHFKADENLYYDSHLKLRSASRILRVVKEFSAATKEVIFDQTRRIHWDKLFDENATFLVEGVLADREKSKVSLGDINNKVREGISHCFTIRKGKAPRVTKTDPRVTVVAFVSRGRCTLSLDTAGKNLHKRGYRLGGHPAPLKETLAAALLRLVGYDGSQVFLDPMCGSGTLAIEAAMIALKKAPQIHRGRGEFGFEWLKDFNRELWRSLQDKARSEQLSAPAAPIYATDIAKEYVDQARDNALRARVEKHIHFVVDAMQDLTAPGSTGILLANLPYGERLGENVELTKLYKEVGDALKQKFTGWTAGLLVPDDAPAGAIGLKPRRKIKLLNGSLAVKLLIFDIYEGSARR